MTNLIKKLEAEILKFAKISKNIIVKHTYIISFILLHIKFFKNWIDGFGENPILMKHWLLQLRIQYCVCFHETTSFHNNHVWR